MIFPVPNTLQNDYALLKPILQQCPESKHQSLCWVHGGHRKCGICCRDNSVSQCSSDPKHHCPICGHDSRGGQGHVGKREGRRAGLLPKRITNVIWLQGLACFRRDRRLKKTICNRKVSTISFYSSLWDWQEKNFIQTEKADKNRT